MLFLAKKIKRVNDVARVNLTIDLHGMTQDEAFKTLRACILESARKQHKNILVITGKSGVLHDVAPRWIAHNTAEFSSVLKIKNAPTAMGGDGAFIIALKKSKTIN